MARGLGSSPSSALDAVQDLRQARPASRPGSGNVQPRLWSKGRFLSNGEPQKIRVWNMLM